MKTADDEFPQDDTTHLSVAFNMLGRHKFGAQWPKEMTKVVRLGPRRRNYDPESRSKGQWTLKALRQCIHNGWLPLFYFTDGPSGKRINYFENPNGPPLDALYPQPIDDEECGQILLHDNEIYWCKVDVSEFASVLRTKFQDGAIGKRGPVRTFKGFDNALEIFFKENPTGLRNGEVTNALKLTFKGTWPEKTTRNIRINEARDKVIAERRTAK